MSEPHTYIVRHIPGAEPAPRRPGKRARAAKPVSPDIQEALADNYVLLAATVLGEAWRDAMSNVRASKQDRASARMFLGHSPLADSMASVCGVDLALLRQGRITENVPMTMPGFYIELPDDGDGHRHHTDNRPIVIKGSVTPLRPGAGDVIVIEQPVELAASIRVVPATNWVPVESRVAGAISDREYARLLARVQGISKTYVTAARRRAMGPSKLESKTRGTRAAKSQRKVAAESSPAEVVGVVGGG